VQQRAMVEGKYGKAGQLHGICPGLANTVYRNIELCLCPENGVTTFWLSRSCVGRFSIDDNRTSQARSVNTSPLGWTEVARSNPLLTILLSDSKL
jgi:hypothetical protein